MATRILAYNLPAGVPEMAPQQSARFDVPAGTNRLMVYATAPASLYGSALWGVAISVETSSDGGLTWYESARVRAAVGSTVGATPGRADGMEPGEIPSDSNDFAWLPESSAGAEVSVVYDNPTLPNRVPVALGGGTVKARASITALGGNPSGDNVLLAAVAECYDADDAVVPINPNTLAS